MFGLKFHKLKEALPQLHILTFKRNVALQLHIRLSAITFFFSSLQLQIRNFKEWNVALCLSILQLSTGEAHSKKSCEA
jgi:hypothetical protein